MLCPHCHAEVTIPHEATALDESSSASLTMPQFETDGADALESQSFFEAWLGPNMRLKDNVLQGLFTLICVLVLSVWGYVFENHTFEGAMHGTIAGLVVGFLVGGFFLMVFRLFKHE